MGTGRAAGWTLGATPDNPHLPLPDATTARVHSRVNRVARQPPGVLAERSGSEHIAGCSSSGGASGP